MPNTALNRTTVSLLTNKSGGAVAQGDVVILGTATAKAFTTTTTSGYSAGMVGVVIDSSIADNASGLVATAGWVPKINLSGAATLYDLIKTHTVAKQGVRHAAPAVEGDFAQALQASATPEAILLGFPVPAAAVGGAPGDATYLTFDADGALSAEQVVSTFQLVNEIKGWPPIVNTGDLDALNLWWDKVGTPTTAPTVTDTSVAGLTDNYELCLKVVADGANEGLSQRYTYADEPRVKSGRVVSALLAIWSVSAVSVTAKLVNSDATETAAAAVTAAAWTIVEIPNHTLAGTYCDLQVTAGAAGTFYVVPLGMNIGARGFPLKPRGSRYVECSRTTLVAGVDPGGADWTNVDATANSSPLTHKLDFEVYYSNATTLTQRVQIRRNGSADTAGRVSSYINVLNQPVLSHMQVAVDDSQIFQYKTGAAAGDGESVGIYLMGWFEWE